MADMTRFNEFLQSEYKRAAEEHPQRLVDVKRVGEAAADFLETLGASDHEGLNSVLALGPLYGGKEEDKVTIGQVEDILRNFINIKINGL